MATPPTYPDAKDLAEGTGTRAFAAVTTQAGDYIVVEGIGENGTDVTDLPPTATGLTFTKQTDNAADVNDTHIQQWTAPDATGGSRTVTITPAGAGSYNAHLTVVRGSGGPSGTGTSLTAQTVSVVRAGDNSGMFMAVGDWSAGAVGSPSWTPGGTTQASQQGTQATYLFGRWDDSGAAGTASHGISSPSYTTPSIAVLEMLGTTGGAGAGADIPPPKLPLHLLLRLIAARQRRWDPAVASPAVGYVPQVVVARPRRADPRLRRGEFLPVVPAAVVAAAPDWVSPVIQPHPPKRPPQRRGEFLQLPLPVPTYPAPVVTSRRRPAAWRRGEFFAVPPAAPVSAPPLFIPASLARRRHPALTRRGEFQPLPPAVVLGGPGPWLPSHLTHRRMPGQTRRAEWFQIVAPAVLPAIPQIIEGRRPAAPLRRRGTFARVVAVVGQPPSITTQRRRLRPIQRRGQFLPWWPQAAPPQPSVWRPTTIRGRASRYQPTRRGRFIEPFLAQFAVSGIPARSTVTETSHTASLTTPTASTTTAPQAGSLTTSNRSRVDTRNRSAVNEP